MNAAKTLREAMGQTQPDFAAYLSISRDQLAKNEAGLRPLPTGALLKLGAIELGMAHTAPARTAAEIQKEEAAVKKMLVAQEQEHHFHAMATTRKLEAMCKRHRQCLKTLQVTSWLLANPPAGKRSKIDKQCLEIMRDKALRKMNACGPAAQALLQLEADVHLYHAARARAMMG
jgi:transcriptional regulator with XRE-family HTH domain